MIGVKQLHKYTPLGFHVHVKLYMDVPYKYPVNLALNVERIQILYEQLMKYAIPAALHYTDYVDTDYK